MKIKKKITLRSFWQILIISIFSLILLSHIFNKYLFYHYFHENFDNKNYYDALYGTGDIGCKTLKIIDPDIIFIGDSSGYHNWDLEIIKNKTNLKIGSCFLPGFTIHSIDILINYFRSIDVRPKNIILSYNYRTFAEENEGKGFKQQHKEMLSNIQKNQIQYNLKLFFRKLRGKSFFDITYPDNIEIENFLQSKNNKARINQLVEKIINENLETSGFKNYQSMVSKIKNIKTSENIKLLTNFCNYVKDSESKLILVRTPASFYLEKNLKEQLTSKLILKNYLKECSGNKFFEKTIINFENRNEFFFLNQYDQKKFLNLKQFLDYQNQNKYDANFYDFTHMNKYGAKKFSKQWINKNIDFFKNENK